MKALARRFLLIFGLLAASLTPTLVQFYAMFTLDPADFGILVLAYIPFSLGNAIVYSLVCEPWSSGGSPTEEKPQYDTALLIISTISGVVALGVGATLGAFGSGALIGVAIACSVFRLGSRYASVIRDRRRYVSPPDNAGLAVLIVGLILVIYVGPSIPTIATAWCASALTAALLSELPKAVAPRSSVRNWLKDYWPKSRVLLADAAMTEVGTIGLPIILAPMMGVAKFGVFRAAASITAPVRIFLNPLRPYLAKQPITKLVSARTAVISLTLSVIAGTGAWLALSTVRVSGLLSESVIAALSHHAAAVGFFVLTYGLSVFSYHLLRMHVAGRSLMRYRAMQLIVQIAGPVLGFIVGDVSGAIVGRALAFVVGLTQSTVSLRLHARN